MTFPRGARCAPGRRVAAVWLAFCLVVAAGCTSGDGRKRYPVEGEVRLGGEPLAEGTIIFTPEAGDHDADVGQIVAGKYKLVATEGPKKVAVKATKLTAGTEPSALGGPPSPIVVSLIPDKYDRETILKATIAPQANQLPPFELTKE